MLLRMEESPYGGLVGAVFCYDLLIYLIGTSLYNPHLFSLSKGPETPNPFIKKRLPPRQESAGLYPKIFQCPEYIKKQYLVKGYAVQSITQGKMPPPLFALLFMQFTSQGRVLTPICDVLFDSTTFHGILQTPFVVILNNNFQNNFPEQQMTKLFIDSPSTYNSVSREDELFSLASSQEVYRPNRNPKKNRLWLKNKKKSIKTSSFNRSLWTLAQNTAYKQFLIGNSKLFDQDRQGRKILKINVMMSKLIKSRSADQCRSHHQKMMKYHRSIPQIVKHIEQLEGDIVGSNGKEEDIDGFQRKLSKTELIDFNDYEGQMRARPEDGDLLEMFLTFSS